MKRTLLGLLLALLLLGCGGGEANMAVTVTRIDPNPDCPFPDADDGNRAHDLAWDPTGTYLSVGGWNSAGDKLFAWYKWDGSSLTELTPPSSAPTAVVGQAWDPTSTYLAIGVGEWYSYNLPCDNSLLLYKRTGDTLALVDTYTPPYDRNIGRVRWLPDSGDGNTYLLVSSGNDYYGPWGAVDGFGTAGVGTHSLALFQRTGDSIAFDTSYEVDTNYGFGVGFDLAVHPSGDYVAWSMEAYTFDDYDAGRTWVFSWDGAGTLTKVAGPYKIGGYPWQIDIAWNPAGTHLAQANSDGTYDYSGVVLWKWDGGAETLTKLTLADMEIDPPGLDDFEAYDVNWHPTEPYLLATGVNGGAADYMTRLYKLVGDDFEYQAHELDEDIYAQGYAGVWHPDGTMFAQASEGSGNYLYLYEVTGLTGGAGDIALKISLDSWSYPFDSGDHVNPAPVIVSPYDPDLYAWLRVRHDSGTGKIYVETAPSGCGIWTVRMEQALPVTADFSKLGIMMNSWVDTNFGDTEVARPGYFGPFNPVPSDFTLPLLTLIGDAPLVGGTTLKILPLLTKIST